jgi:hypothetical protein
VSSCCVYLGQGYKVTSPRQYLEALLRVSFLSFTSSLLYHKLEKALCLLRTV